MVGRTRVAMRTRCFLIGYPVSHSLSPVMFAAAFRALGLDWTYQALAVPAGGPLRDLLADLADRGAVGVNVTMPLKREVLAHCRSLSPRAEAVGAANTLTLREEGWEADNTDWPGLALAISEAAGSALARGRSGVVFGAGGAAAAAGFCLAEMGFPVVIVSRDRSRGQELAARVGGEYVPWGDRAVPALAEQAAVVVNATPLGMERAPEPDPTPVDCPLPPGVMPAPDAVACELVYHPPETEFLKRARKAGARVVSGLSVLLWQAVPALERWTGRPAPVEAMREALFASVPRGHAEKEGAADRGAADCDT